MNKEVFLIYAKKEVTDSVYDYRTCAKNWDDAMEILERLAKYNQSVQYLHIEEGSVTFGRIFSYDGKLDDSKVYKKSGSVLN